MLPEELGELARDLLAYNKALGVLGRYSLATVTPTALGLHRLVQAVIRARLEDQERPVGRRPRWSCSTPPSRTDSWEVARWPTCQRLLPHVLAATEHAERLEVAAQQTGLAAGPGVDLSAGAGAIPAGQTAGRAGPDRSPSRPSAR